MNYKESVLAGELSPEAIQIQIKKWADEGCHRPLYVFLGLAWQEYVMYRYRPKDFYMYMLIQRKLKHK